MEPVHIFYRELPLHENDIFMANLTKKNEMEEVKFKKSREYTVTGLSINQDIDSDHVVVTDTEKKGAISKLIQKLVKEKKESDLDLRIYNKEVFEKIIPFTKKTDSEVPAIKYTIYNITTKK